MSDKQENPATIQYIATGDNNVFQFPFETFDDSDVDVYIDDCPVSEGFSFQANADRSAGDVVFEAAPAAGKKITLDRNLAIEKVPGFTESGTFRSIVINTALSRIVAYCQQLLGYANRSVRLPPFSDYADTTLPLPDKGKAIVWDQNGKTLRNSVINVDDVVGVTNEARDNAAASAKAAAASETAARKSEDAAAKTAADFDDHADERQAEFDRNAAEKQDAVDASTELARKYAQGTVEEMPDGSAKQYFEKVQEIAEGFKTDELKKIGYEQMRTVTVSGDLSLDLQGKDEIIVLSVSAQAGISFNISALNFDNNSFTVQLLLVFPSGAKTLAFTPPEGKTFKYMNGFKPDFSSGADHWIVLRQIAGRNSMTISDAGTETGG